MVHDVRREPDRARAGRGRFRTPVAGYRFAARPPGADHPRPGQGVLLHHERGHPVDDWAVAIWTRSEDGIPWRIGYLERSVAARIGPRISRGRRVIGEVVGWRSEPHGRWRQPVIEVDRSDVEPTLGDAPSSGDASDTSDASDAPATAGAGQPRKTA